MERRRVVENAERMRRRRDSRVGMPDKLPVALALGVVMFAAMDWQQIVALLIVAAAVALFVWGRVRRRKFQFGRDTHCGCSSPSAKGSQSSIIFHARKGEQPRVVVKMK